MNKTFTLLFFAGLISLGSYQLKAQEKETFKKKGLILNFKSLDANFDPAVKERMVKTFFQVYPKLMKEYNDNADTEVNFVVDTAYKGVAATGGGRVVFNPDWFKKHPEDIDVVTHEVMHIVQNYGRHSGPGWLTEGIADYVRYKFGVDNPGAGWSLTPFKASQSYTNSYRITARFLAWLESHGNKNIVKNLDTAMRDHTYTKDIWKNETGKSLDELWKTYSENPVL